MCALIMGAWSTAVLLWQLFEISYHLKVHSLFDLSSNSNMGMNILTASPFPDFDTGFVVLMYICFV